MIQYQINYIIGFATGGFACCCLSLNADINSVKNDYYLFSQDERYTIATYFPAIEPRLQNKFKTPLDGKKLTTANIDFCKSCAKGRISIELIIFNQQQ